MKQKLFGAAALVAFVLFGASCDEQKQSEFNFDSVTQEVTVSAKVTYDAGVKIDPNNPKSYILANAEPAQFKKVFIEIPYAQYSAGAQGVRIFEAVTDSAGMFTISVPTKSTGVVGTIRLEEFTAVHQEYDRMGDDGKPILKVQLYTYSTPDDLAGAPGAGPVQFTLKPGAFTFPSNNDLCYKGEAVDEEVYNEQVTIAGSISLAYEKAYRVGAFQKGKNAIVEFKITYNTEDNNPLLANPDVNGDDLTLTFGTVADNQGNYSITLPMKSLKTGFTINTIKVLGVGDNLFIHYTDSTTQITVPGAYMSAQNNIRNADLDFREVVSGISYNLGDKKLPFIPYYNGDILPGGTPEPENWDANLVGWAAAKFNETYNQTVKYEGRVYMPELSAYGIGIYTNSQQEITLTSAIAPYNNLDANNVPHPYTILTDKNGYFSFEIPVKDENIDPGFVIAPKEARMPFVFINSKGESITYSQGTYGFKDIVPTKDNAKWYEVGNVYFDYTPALAEQTDEWNADLIGWYVDPNFKETVKVTGKMLFAYEKSYGIGDYKPLNKLVTVRDATAGAPARNFAVMPAADGSFDFDLPVKDKNAKRTLQVINTQLHNTAYHVLDYIHYPKYGANPRTLEGYYSRKHVIFDTAQDRDTWNILGTYYMFIDSDPILANSDLVSDCDTYLDDLAGWLKRGSDANAQGAIKMTLSATATGSAKIAQETAYMEGTMSPAQHMLIPVMVGADQIHVLTDNTGKFSFDVYYKNESELHDNLLNAAGAVAVHTEEFVHFEDAKGKKQTLSGDYFGQKVTKKDAKWNEMGTIYYQFTPDGVIPNWNTFKDISGWHNYLQDYEFSKTITGFAKLAKEDAFLIGSYQGEKDIPVKFWWDINDDDFIDWDEPVYIGKTDKDGKFSITVPLENETDEPIIKFENPVYQYEPGFIHYDDPKSSATRVLKGDYNGVQVKDEDAAWNDMGTIYYTFTPDATSLATVDFWTNYAENIAGWAKANDANDELKVNKTVTGKVYLAKETSFMTGSYQTEANVPVRIRIGAITYAAPTAANGTFSIPVLVEQENSEPNVTVLYVNPFLNDGFVYKEFTHYIDEQNKTLTIKGRYEGENVEDADKDWNEKSTIYYKFIPDDAGEAKYWNDYTQYLAGWFYRDGYDFDNTVTGNVKMAQETSFLKGNFVDGKSIPVKIYYDINGNGVINANEPVFVSLTDAQGKFSVPVKLQDADDEPDVKISFDDIPEEKFLHYANETGKSKEIPGNYKGEQVNDDNAEWNEMGTIYYMFDPDNAGTIENWNTYTKYTADWFHMEGYTVSKAVTGSVKMAQETAYLKGNFVDGKDIPVKVYFDDNHDGVLDVNEPVFVSLTDAQGKFSVPVKLEDEEDEPDVKISFDDIPEDKFLHYANATGKSKEIPGNYEGDQVKDENAKWNEMGTIYYMFNPDNAGTIENWNTYTKYTAGWFHKEGYNINKTVTGYVKVARETGFLTGDFGNDAKDIEVKIQLDADPDLIFAATTDAQGKFEIVVAIENEEDEPNVDVLDLATGFNYDKFTHYVDAQGKTKTLKGKYTGALVDDDDADWNEAGTIYYTYQPDGTIINNKPADWDDLIKYTAGWVFKKAYNFKSNVTGSIKLAKETGYLTGDYQVEKDIPVLIQLDGDLKFAAPTDAQGKFSIPVIFENEDDEPGVTVVGLGYGVNDGFEYKKFTHYVDTLGKTATLEGKYKGKQITVEDHAWQDAGTMYYTFYPTNVPDGWNTYNKFTAGWIKNAGFTYPKTVSGVVKIAQETGFLKGDFNANAHYTRVLVKVANSDDRKYMVPVNADGSYQVTIEVEDQYDEPNVQVILNDIEGIKFTDYVNSTKTKKIEGHFEGTNVKEDDTEWADLGTAYYTFEPDAPSDTWNNYTQYTSGWYYKKGYTYPKAVSGSVKLSCETKYWEANWSGPSTDIPVKIFIDNNSNGVWNNGEPYYVTSTEEGGTFSLNVYLQKSSDEPDVVWTASNITLDELDKYQYLHFTTPGTTTKTKLAGTYNHAGTIKKGGSKWYQLGTRYYRFSPTAAPASWHQNKLYGITVWPDGFNNKLTVKGAVQKAVEKFTTGAASAEEIWEYVPYAYSTVTIELDGNDYEFNVCAESNGKFTLYVYDNVIPDDLPITVVPDNIDEQLKHWADKSDIESADMIDGEYVSANNVKKANPIDKSGTNTYDFQTAIPYSAKLIFSPDAAPGNWGDYVWDNDGK